MPPTSDSSAFAPRRSPPTSQYRTRADLRTPSFLAPRVVDKLVSALFLGTLFLSQGRSATVSASSTESTINICFMWVWARVGKPGSHATARLLPCR